MRQSFLLILAFSFSLTLTVPASESPATSSQAWSEDLTVASASAAASGKDVLIFFTGSNWCPPCKQMHRMSLGTPEFIAAASATYALVVLDFPKGDHNQDSKVTATNQRHAKEFQVNSFPTLWLVTAAGRPYAKSSYIDGDSSVVLDELAMLQARKGVVESAFQAAWTSEGATRAKGLAAALELIDEPLPAARFQKEVNEIIRIDADGSLGLRGALYADTVRMELNELLMNEEFDAVHIRVTKELASKTLTPAFRAELHHLLASLAYGRKDFSVVITNLKAAITANPSDPRNAQLTQIIERIQGEMTSASAAAKP